MSLFSYQDVTTASPYQRRHKILLQQETENEKRPFEIQRLERICDGANGGDVNLRRAPPWGRLGFSSYHQGPLFLLIGFLVMHLLQQCPYRNQLVHESNNHMHEYSFFFLNTTSFLHSQIDKRVMTRIIKPKDCWNIGPIQVVHIRLLVVAPSIVRARVDQMTSIFL
jgi:hypothetical protein